MSPRPRVGDPADPVTTESPVTPPPPPSPASGLFPPVASGQDRPPGIWARVSSSDLDLRNTWQILAGAILLPLGVAVILLGWAGAAHGRVDQQQIPYIISGGLLGLAIVIIGCFFYWAHWLYRIYDQADLHHQEAMREQAEQMRALLEVLRSDRAVSVDGSADGAGSAGSSGGAVPPSRNGASPAYVATPTGTNFHTPACPIVANRLSSVRSVSTEEVARLRPCRICEPLVVD